MFKETKNKILDLRENYQKIKFYEIEIKLIDIEKELLIVINMENVLIKPLVKEFISYVRKFKDKLYKIEHKERVNTMIEIENKINFIIDKQIEAEKYHKNLITKMKQKNKDELGDTDRYYHILKLKLLERGYSEEEYEKLYKCML